MMRAVYKDQHGATYSCPVEIHENKWMMLTSEGFQAISHKFQDDVGGLLTFVEYRETKVEPDTRLHLEPKQPGQSSLAQLQSAHSKVEAQARSARHQERQQVLAETSQPDAQRVRQAREYAEQILHARKPRGGGAFVIKNGE